MPKKQIRGKKGCGNNTLPKILERKGIIDVTATQKDEKKIRKKSRKYAPYTTLIEVSEGKTTGVNICQKDGGYEIAGNNEKNIDADKATLKPWNLGMIEQNRKHSYGTEPINIRTIPHCFTLSISPLASTLDIELRLDFGPIISLTLSTTRSTETEATHG